MLGFLLQTSISDGVWTTEWRNICFSSIWCNFCLPDLFETANTVVLASCNQSSHFLVVIPFYRFTHLVPHLGLKIQTLQGIWLNFGYLNILLHLYFENLTFVNIEFTAFFVSCVLGKMIEPELAFADLNDDMACASAYLQYVVGALVYSMLLDTLCFRYGCSMFIFKQMSTLTSFT